MKGHCYSCTHPLTEEAEGPLENYCRWCVDDQGEIKPYETVQEGIASWFMGWVPGLEQETAMKRAQIFMSSLPAWASDNVEEE